MTRQFTPIENPDLGSVWVWFESQSALLAEERLMMLARAGSGDGSALRAHQIQFVGLTTVEIADFFDTQRTQLELLTMFELLAVTEATLRLEFQSRVRSARRIPYRGDSGVSIVKPVGAFASMRRFSTH